ncbi:MAG: PilZ domain-containing protein [Pseudomonadales bacterium]
MMVTAATDYIAGSRSATRRKEERRAVVGKAVVQVVESANPSLVGTTFKSEIMDVSRSGMRLVCQEFIEDSRLDIWLAIEGINDKLFVSAEVRWASWDQHGDYELGVEIRDDAATDSRSWFLLWE